MYSSAVLQISQEDYRAAIAHLMSDSKFWCHVICYNVPFAVLFFALLLLACLVIVPLAEHARSDRRPNEIGSAHARHTGIEVVHAGLVWLLALTLYVLTMQISKKKVTIVSLYSLVNCGHFSRIAGQLFSNFLFHTY